MTETAGWEADVVLADGQIVLLRPLTPSDRGDLVAFYSRVSPESKYLRFLAAHPRLTEEQLDQWTVMSRDSLTLGLWESGNLIATARYDVLRQDGHQPAEEAPGERIAEVSFLVEDRAQGRGAANLLLEHLAQAGREAEISRFWAETLPENRAMLQVFVRAGYSMVPQLEDGLVVVEFSVEPTEKSRLVMEQREHRAEANAIRSLLYPESVAIVGAVASVGHLVSALVKARYTGRVVVESCMDTADDIAISLTNITGDLDLVVIPFIQGDVDPILAAASARGARGILMYSGGKDISLGLRQSRHFVATARRYGLRAFGPASLGMINTDPELSLNLTPAPLPLPGPVSMFTQSAGIAAISLTDAVHRGLPLNHFVSTGTYADVTANDMMQFWQHDENTQVCVLSLDTVGNPRKFFRLLRRLAQHKTVLVFLPSRALTSARYHHAETVELPSAPVEALDEVIRRVGAIVVDRRETLLDIARILSVQPEPNGRNVRILTNSTDLTYQMKQGARRVGLEPSVPQRASTSQGSVYDELADAVRDAMADETVDSVMVTIVGTGSNSIPRTRQVLEKLAENSTKTLVASLVSFDDDAVSAGTGKLPLLANYTAGLEALGLLANHVPPRPETGEDPAGTVLETPDDPPRDEALEIIDAALGAEERTIELDEQSTRDLLHLYSIDVLPARLVGSVEEAVAAAEELSWNVVLRMDHPAFIGRPDIVPIVKNIDDAEAMVDAWESIHRAAPTLGASAEIRVQPTAEPGPSLTIRGIEDATLGPMISVGVSGIATELLGDRSWAVPVGSRADARASLEALRAAPVLHGFQGSPPANIEALVDILVRLGQLKREIPSVIDIELAPVLAGRASAWVAGARARISPVPTERDPLMRYL